MNEVKQTLKDFVSGVVRVVEAKVRMFPRVPKKWDNVVKGAVLTDMIQDCIADYGLEEQVVHEYDAPVDFVWSYLSFGWECKRFVDEEYVTKRWLEVYVLNRFRKHERFTGERIRHRALVVNEKRWEKPLDCWLATKGIHVLEVGMLRSRLEVAQAMEVFKVWFLDMLWKICNEELKNVG